MQPLIRREDYGDYIICIGYSNRDWDTLIQAYSFLNSYLKLRLIGHVDEKYSSVVGIEQYPVMNIKELIQQIYIPRFSVLPLESCNYSIEQMTLLQQMVLGKCVVAAVCQVL